MISRSASFVWLLPALALTIGLTGCGRVPAQAVQPDPTPVMVSCPVERQVTDYADYTARTAAVDSVKVRAHVWGYLEKVNFKEGALVTKGDVLFELDQRPYVAEVDRARGQLEQAKASLNQAIAQLGQAEAQVDKTAANLSYQRKRFDRAKQLRPKGVITQEEFDQNESETLQTDADLEAAKAQVGASKAAIGTAKATVQADEAALATAELNLQYTKVTAPVTGRVSRYVVTVGNLIPAGDQNGGTLLTMIVSVDPMYAYFDVDEYTALRVRKLAREGKSDSPRDGGYPVSLGLANEEGYPHQGTVNFVENQVNPKTGTIRLRGVFRNEQEHLLPGFFARVRGPIGRPHHALLVTDRALDSDQGQKTLYVVNDKNEVVSRPVRVGALHDGLREITEGLNPGERVIVNGLQHVRPGITVEPKLAEMPEGTPDQISDL